ncbi:hypothetical protein LCM20_07785 [Halobacillus litoralis]|uniref:hypothetical protein n=1 Tax=Halobacillus litoralis TaxID=45668 RepID=UPI001CD4E140|nr:hypothetical protein [Halobacillus litoralis]MCA0970481.1 hypothetical protein [Halobacillus litoralis]
MGELFIAMAVMGVVLFILYKLKILKFNSVTGYYKKSSKGVSATYKKLNGFEQFSFLLKKEQSYDLHYDLEIEAGVMKLIMRDKGKRVIFEKEMDSDLEDVFTFTTVKRLHRVEIEGEQAKGKCNFHFKERTT